MPILSEIPVGVTWVPLTGGGQFNATIRTGIYEGNSSLQTTPTCPNGNCRWPRFHAIAFCSQCADVTNLTATTIAVDPGRTNLSDTIKQIMSDAAANRTFLPSLKYPTRKEITLTPPNGLSTDADVQMASWSGWLGQDALWTGWISWLPYINGQAPTTVIDTNHTRHTTWSLNYNDPLDPALDFIVSNDNWINTTVAGISGPLIALGHLSMDYTGDSTEGKLVKVQECALTPCVHEYDARVTNNTFFLDVLSTTYGYMSGSTDEMNWSAVANGTTFSISDSGFSLSNMAFWANAFLIGSISQNPEIFCNISNFTEASRFSENCLTSNVAQPGFFDDAFPASSEEMQAIDALRNFSQTLINVANSITDLTHRFHNTQVLGDVLAAETFVHVRWVWVTFPLLLLLMSLLTLFVTIDRTRRNKIEVWKSSTLPLLYHGPDNMSAWSDAAFPVSLSTASSMEMDSERLLVQLTRTEGTGIWNLKQTP